MKITGKALRLNNGALIHKEYYVEMRKIIDSVGKKIQINNKNNGKNNTTR
jgi:hypothetical protein